MKRMGLSALAAPATALLGLVWAAVACSLAGSGSAPPTATVALPSAPVASYPSAASAIPSPSSPPPTATLETPTSPAPPAPSIGPLLQPPSGHLGIHRAGVQGLLGSYCWTEAAQRACADYPGFSDRSNNLPGFTLDGPDSELQFGLDGDYPFATWSASYIDSADATVSLGRGGTSFDPDARPSFAPITEAAFAAPTDSGTWIVQVAVRFGQGGDAIYGWKVTVP